MSSNRAVQRYRALIEEMDNIMSSITPGGTLLLRQTVGTHYMTEEDLGHFRENLLRTMIQRMRSASSDSEEPDSE